MISILGEGTIYGKGLIPETESVLKGLSALQGHIKFHVLMHHFNQIATICITLRKLSERPLGFITHSFYVELR